MSPAAIENRPLPPLVEPDRTQVFRRLRNKKLYSDLIILFTLAILGLMLILILDNFHPEPLVSLLILGCAVLIGIVVVIRERARLRDDTNSYLWLFGIAWQQTMLESQIDLAAPAIENDVVVIRWRTNAPRETLLLGYVSEGCQMKNVAEATQRKLIASTRISSTERSGAIKRLLADCKGSIRILRFFLSEILSNILPILIHRSWLSHTH